MAKYVIEIPDEVKWIQYIQQTGHGTQNLKVESVYDLTPYSEPDEDESYGVNRYKAIGLAFLKWLGNDVGDKLKSADDVYQFLDKNCYNKDAVEQEVWEFARTVRRMSFSDWGKCFELYTLAGIFDLNYSEAKAKYEEWRKENDEIHVGDEVEAKPGNKACVLNENPDGTQVFVLKADGTTAWWSKCTVHKTGKNHPEVVELLKKMSEE